MPGRAFSTRDNSRVPSTARMLLLAAAVLGLGATVILVVSDDARFLKMGILAALWAALVGAFLAARFRRQVADRGDDVSSMQTIYELELEREIAARREYELELEAEAKRAAEEKSRQDIDALRTELGALRETLQTLLGGEVLVERFALQAQATRMRSLPDENHQLPAAGQMVKRLNPAASQQPPQQTKPQVIIPAEQKTELMDRVSDRQPPRQNVRPQPQRPQPQRPPREPADRQVQIRQPRRDEPNSGWWDPVTPPMAGARQEQYRQPVAGDSANSLDESIDMSWTPSWERNKPPQQMSQPMPQPPQKSQPLPQVSQPLPQPGRPPRAPKKLEPQPSRPMPRPEVEAPTSIQPLPEPPTRAAEPVPPPVAPPPVVRPPEPPPPPPPPARKPERVVQPPVGETGGRRRAGEESSGGRRRAPEPVAETGGGRRRKPEGAPSWQETLGAQQSGSHSKPAPPPEPTGSHAEGKSVNELLAAYGGNGEPPRRRRRRDD